jgi:hypothetical protein
MYSTLDGAKRCAKQLKRLMERARLIYPLVKCQTAVAKAGDYRDWHDLSKNIADRQSDGLPYDYWGRLIRALPEPCRFLIYTSLRKREADEGSAEAWIPHVLPFAMGLEGVLRKESPTLVPGSGKDQRLRLNIVSSLLMGNEGPRGLYPKLDPETLDVVVECPLRDALPKLARHPRFDQAAAALESAGLIRVGGNGVRILAPVNPEVRRRILARADAWNVRQEPKIEYLTMDDDMAAAMRHQFELDRAEGGPKTPYASLDYRDIRLASRFSVAREFEVMKAVVDAMPDDVRLRLSSIYCDSRANSDYIVEVTLGMNRRALANHVREAFVEATDGFNGLCVRHGDDAVSFDPEWAGDEIYYDALV